MIRGVSYEINEAFNCNINYEREFQWEKGSNLTRKIITKFKSRLFFFKFVNINWLRKEIEYYTMTIWHATVLQSGR